MSTANTAISTKTPQFSHHIEHVIAKQHGGTGVIDNLALACHHCNELKGPNLTGLDPVSGQITRLFHPKLDQWNEHFQIHHGLLAGLTDIGRTTIHLLKMNESDRIEIRRAS